VKDLTVDELPIALPRLLRRGTHPRGVTNYIGGKNHFAGDRALADARVVHWPRADGLPREPAGFSARRQVLAGEAGIRPVPSTSARAADHCERPRDRAGGFSAPFMRVGYVGQRTRWGSRTKPGGITSARPRVRTLYRPELEVAGRQMSRRGRSVKNSDQPGALGCGTAGALPSREEGTSRKRCWTLPRSPPSGFLHGGVAHKRSSTDTEGVAGPGKRV